MLLKIYSEILRKVECDSQRRISLGNIIEAEKMLKLEKKQIPEDIDYDKIRNS